MAAISVLTGLPRRTVKAHGAVCFNVFVENRAKYYHVYPQV